jgi:PAS domain S-box-containing protein
MSSVEPTPRRKIPAIVAELRQEEQAGRLTTTHSPTTTTTIPPPQPHHDDTPPEPTDVNPPILGMFHGKDEQQLLQILFDNSPTPTLLLDTHHRIVSWNTAATTLLHTNRTDLFLTPFTTLLSTQDKHLTHHITTQHEPTKHYHVHTRHTTPHPLTLTVLKIHDHDTTQGYVILLQHDPTSPTPPLNPDGTLHNDALFTTTSTPIAITDHTGTISTANPAFLHLFNITTTDLATTSLATLLKLKHTLTDLLQQTLENGPWTGEAILPKKKKPSTHLLLTIAPLPTPHDTPPSFMITCTDITAYTTAIHVSREHQSRFRFVLEHSLNIIYKINLKKTTFDYVSSSVHTILGYRPDEMKAFTQDDILDRIHPDDRPTTIDALNRHITNYTGKDSPQTFEFRFRCKNNDYRWVSNTSLVLFDANHQPNAIVGNLEDITERKTVWTELVKSEERYRVLAETSADGVFTTDALGRLTYVNPAFEKLLKRRKSQILATPLRTYLLEDSIYFLQQILMDVRKKNEKIENIELDLVAADDTIIPIEVNMAPLMKDHDFIGVVCTVRDIVQRREIEAELKKNERLKTEFMNIAAHELRSPVTPIKGYLDLILHDPDTSDKIKNWAKISLRNADRLLKLVNDILDVARLDSDTMRFDMEKLDTVELLAEVGEDMRPAIAAKHLKFNLTIPPDLPHILGDKNRLSQVFKNLIGNALKFTDTGSISVTAQKDDTHILITVADTGIGISKEELKKIFIKFYQAYTGEDRNNEGTGLGLFISKEIIKKHNGKIWAESDVGTGSRFTIELPYIYKMKIDFQPTV